jgi:hypothetical protein
MRDGRGDATLRAPNTRAGDVPEQRTRNRYR